MEKQQFNPTWLTLMFYAAFAATFVQGTYTSPDIYRWLVGEFFQIGLALLILATFLILTVGALIRSLQAGRFPWGHATAATCALVAAELIWRYGINSLPGTGFKEVAIAVDMAKPIILALGLVAIHSERKVSLRAASSYGEAAAI